MNNSWIATKEQLPLEGVSVETKVADKRGDYSKAVLERHKNLWYSPKTYEYVYYQPSHWRALIS